MEDVARVEARDCVAYAIKTDGTLWSWGTNGSGIPSYFGGDDYSNIGPQQTSPRQVLFGCGMPEPIERTLFVIPKTVPILVDGEETRFPVLMSYNEQGGGTTYVRLRDLAYALNCTRSHFNVEERAEATWLLLGDYSPIGGELTPPALEPQAAVVRRTTFGSSSTLEVAYYNTLTATDQEGSEHMYVRLRDLAFSNTFDVHWDGEKAIIETDTWYTWDECQPTESS